MTPSLAPVFAGVLFALSSQPLCQAASSAPGLDHVVLVVKDLAATSRAFGTIRLLRGFWIDYQQ
jgi:hypothetical protein